MVQYPLHLTTPLERGDPIPEAQYLLHTNRWNHNFHPGAIDGSYGPQTASAAHRAKYFLGYPSNRVNGTYGSELRAYLVPAHHDHAKPLPYLYRVRMRRRANRFTQREKAVACAKTQVGYIEQPPGSNHTKYCDWYYGANVAAEWCLIFVSWCFHQVGSTFKYSYVPALVTDTWLGRHGLRFVSSVDVERGDVVAYNFDSSSQADHAELFDAWADSQHDAFYAIGGNTGPGVEQVARSLRYMSTVQHFIRVPVT